jgi:hypothetical protein
VRLDLDPQPERCPVLLSELHLPQPLVNGGALQVLVGEVWFRGDRPIVIFQRPDQIAGLGSYVCTGAA